MFESEETTTHSSVLVDNDDVSLITDSFKCRETFQMNGAPWYKKLIHFISVVTSQTLWQPRNSEAYQRLEALRWVHAYLSHCMRLVQQIANLRHARTEFERMKTDMLHDRSRLKEDIDQIEIQLQDLRSQYSKSTECGNPTYTIASDVNLLLCDFQRFQDLYRLYNDMINLISKTLADTNRIEKLAFLCGTVRKSDVFASDGYKCFEETLYGLLGQVAECDKTKEYINSQLSIAKNSNLDAALSYGVHLGREHNDNITQNFLASGKITLEPVSILVRDEKQANPSKQYSPQVAAERA